MGADSDGLATVLVQAVCCGADDYANALLRRIARGDETKLQDLRHGILAKIARMDWDSDNGVLEKLTAEIAAEIERAKYGTTNPGN